ncbi:hypothetical protein [Lederbergia citrisecunda]|nr:hypothetical protein [Lederbergia citrisecunda]
MNTIKPHAESFGICDMLEDGMFENIPPLQELYKVKHGQKIKMR